MKSVFFGAVSATALIASAVHAEPQAEVMHWWTSGGEAKSVAVLQEEFVGLTLQTHPFAWGFCQLRGCLTVTDNSYRGS